MPTPILAHPIDPDFREEVAHMPLKPIKPGSGHGGTDYAKGWIGDLSSYRIVHGDVVNNLDMYPWTYGAVKSLTIRLGNYKLFQVMVNCLGPNSRLNPHRDGVTSRLRFHLPVITNPYVRWWDEFSGALHFTEGYWYGPVPYAGVKHAMFNDHETDYRVHIVADFEPPE